MKRLLLIISLFVFVACAPQRKVTTGQATAQSQVSGNIERRDSNSRSVVTMADTDVKIDENIEVIVERFDTSQPVNTITGSPPLAERIITRNIRETTAHQKVNVAESNDNITEQIGDYQRQNVAEVEFKTDKKTGLTWLQRTLVYTGIAAIVGLLIWLVLRVIKGKLKID